MKNPLYPTGFIRVIRGGHWNSSPINLRSAGRNAYAPSNRPNFIGFRIVRTKEEV